MLFPFFSLYITEKFNVGMTQAGIILGLFSISGLFGQMIGGALTDKFGRRKLIMPIYKALVATSDGLAFAKQVFAQAKPGYHPITTGSVQETIANAKPVAPADAAASPPPEAK